MSDFLMPSLGADMDAGTLLEWRVKPGDRVARGDIVAVVDTDKAAIEIEIFENGVVSELLVPEGEKVPVGTPLARVGGAATVTAPPVVTPEVSEPPPVPKPPEEIKHLVSPEAVKGHPHATPAARKHALEYDLDLGTLTGTGKHGVITKGDVEKAAKIASAETAEAKEGHAAETMSPLTPRPRVSPLARRWAKERGVDLTGVTGSGPNGAITQQDVEELDTSASPVSPTTSHKTPAEPKEPDTPAPTKAPSPQDLRYVSMRRAIAAAMSKSKREIPHYYLSTRVDMSKALGWLEEANLERPITERILPAVLLLKATALAARDVPDLNGFWLDNAFVPSDEVHVGVGISLRQGGLIAPAIHDADQKDLPALMSDLRDLVKRARKLQLRSSEMTDATLTTTNLGDQGVESVYGVVYPPQVALVGFGKVTKQPWADGDLLGVRPVMKLTLAADHRASDGHRGGLFLGAIERYLQTPEDL